MKVIATYSNYLTVSATLITTASWGNIYSSLYPGDEVPILIATDISWVGVTGGDATSRVRNRTSIMPTPTPNPPTNEKQIYGKIIGVAGAAVTVDLATGAAPADGRQLTWWFSPASASASALEAYLSLHPFWGTCISNPGLAYSGGTITINAVWLFA